MEENFIKRDLRFIIKEEKDELASAFFALG